MYQKIIPVVMAACLLFATTSCKKGDLVAGYTNSALDITYLRLPGAEPLDVYINGELKLEGIEPGSYRGLNGLTPLILKAGTTNTLAFTKKGVKDILFDSTFTTPVEKNIEFRVAYSDDLDLHGFQEAATAVPADSCRFRLFNNLPEEIYPDGVEIDAELFAFTPAGEMFSTGVVFEHFERKKLHPLLVTMPAFDASGAPSYYLLKFKDRATGSYLTDNLGSEGATVNTDKGKYLLIKAGAVAWGPFLFFAAEPVEL